MHIVKPPPLDYARKLPEPPPLPDYFPKGPPIICPNPNCGYRGASHRVGGGSAALLLALLCVGILPGLLYAIFGMNSHLSCPVCGVFVRKG